MSSSSEVKNRNIKQISVTQRFFWQNPHNDKICKCIAFTLAEVLVTIGIIGIVASMTISSLITTYQKKQTIAQLKKAYTVLAQAIERSKVDNEDIKFWNFDMTSSDFFEFYLKPYMATINNVERESNIDYLEYTRPNGRPSSGIVAFWDPRTKIITLTDGTTFFLTSYSSVQNTTFKAINIDINGYKKPNRVGKDYFSFVLHKEYGLIPYGMNGSNNIDTSYTIYDRAKMISDFTYGCNKQNGAGAGMYCAALILHDNWEIQDDYPW